MSLTVELKERARSDGFDLVGVARAGPAVGADRLRQWLAAGSAGDMGYMERTAELRADPRRVLEGCCSVVAVAMSYRTSRPDSTEGRDDGSAWVSRYAWGRDYHKVLKKRLVRLGRWLAERAGGDWRAFVDTGPVLEREWAARAGLGWIGKNSGLLNRELGSELFLGVLLTSVELEADAPTTEHCGRCTACLDACPTGALVAPGRLEPRLCIAYTTVEHRGELPEAVARSAGTMVAGCDICQEVCPWTRRAPADLHPEFEPAPHRFRPPLAELEALDEEGWREWRRGSALNRIPYRQLRRNLAAARANLDAGRGPGTDQPNNNRSRK